MRIDLPCHGVVNSFAHIAQCDLFALTGRPQLPRQGREPRGWTRLRFIPRSAEMWTSVRCGLRGIRARSWMNAATVGIAAILMQTTQSMQNVSTVQPRNSSGNRTMPAHGLPQAHSEPRLSAA